MLIMGVIFGSLGILAAHSLIKHLSHYYLILVPPLVVAIILGLGLNWGARIGRCSRFNMVTLFLVTICSLVCYGTILFLNDYHDSFPEAPTLGQEGLFLTCDGMNMLAEFPFVSDYVKPTDAQTLHKTLARIPLLSTLLPPLENVEQESAETETSTPETSPEGEPEPVTGEETEPDVITTARDHLGTQVTDFLHALPERAFAPEPVVIGTIFDLVLFVPIQNYLLYPGLTFWKEDNGVRQLAFDERAVQPWMAWIAELVLLWLVTLLITLSGTKKAYRTYQKRLEKRGSSPRQGLQLGGQKEEPEAGKKKKKGFFGKKNKEETRSTDQAGTSEGESLVIEGVAPKKKKKKDKVKKKKLGVFGRSKDEAEDEDVGGTVVLPETPSVGDAQGMPDSDVDFEFSEEEPQEKLYAIILHQYAQERQDDLARLIQQVGQVSEERARRLLKVPSLIQRDVTTHQANIAIEKFNQVQAQVRLISMEQLLQLQNKQRQSAVLKPESPNSQSVLSPDTGERYALILRKFDSSQRKPILELLSSLSGTPVTELQQSLKTPALVLRDASKDEVTMIAQQFKNIHADVKVLTMAELQQLMAKK